MVTFRLYPPGRRAPATAARRRGPSRRSAPGVVRTLALVVALSSATAAGSALATAHAEAQTGPWVEPVEGPVVDGYRPPAHVGAPGNRGWEYLTDPGTVVVAAGDGVVVFAGPIGGSRYVSIQHPDGRRTTYSHVVSIDVDAGDPVTAGDPIATSGERLHFGLRVGDDYRDPGELFAASTPAAPSIATTVEDGLRLIPAAERAAVARTRTPDRLVSRPAVARTTGLGRWLASVELPPAGTAGAARGW